MRFTVSVVAYNWCNKGFFISISATTDVIYLLFYLFKCFIITFVFITDKIKCIFLYQLKNQYKKLWLSTLPLSISIVELI